MNFKHTCDCCVYLGTHTNSEYKHISDLYYCQEMNLLVARYGSHYSNYVEGHIEETGLLPHEENDILKLFHLKDSKEEIIEARKLALIFLENNKDTYIRKIDLS